MKGFVEFFSDYRGFGFISGSDKNQYFVHVSQINTDELKTLEVGQVVTFDPTSTKKGLQAVNVVLPEPEITKEPVEQVFVLKHNPFTPQAPIINTKKFAGRKESILNAIDALFNNKNLLVLGPRGIGKSSVAYQLLALTKGSKELLGKLNISLGGFKFKNLTGDHRCVPGNSIYDICNGLLTTFCEMIGQDNTEEKKKTMHGINLKFIQFKSETETKEIAPTDISLEFVSKIEKLVKKCYLKRKSITFVIDEIDVLDSDVEIAPFLKATSEKFHLNNFVDVSFIVSGVTGTITSLISQHPSVSRLFENVSLPKMHISELSDIIDAALEDTKTKISDEARNQIINLSNNFPQPIHLLGYHSFKIDSNDFIEIDDVESAKSAIVSEIRKQDFESKFDRIAPGAMTEIIRILAQAPLETVNLNYLRSNLRHMSDDQIVGSSAQLQKIGIVEKQHRNVYRFHDPLFKIYLRWLFGMDQF